MSLLKTINDKGAVLEWSPISSKPNVVAIATKVILYHHHHYHHHYYHHHHHHDYNCYQFIIIHYN